MKNIIMKKRIEKWKSKSIGNKISDIIFIVFIIAILTPTGRLAIGGFVNKIKAQIIQPSIENDNNSFVLSSSDYDWKLTDINNNAINLNNFRGKVIFLNLWATWCPPCVGEMPDIQNLYDEFKNDERIEFLLISNQKNEEVKNFVQKREYTFPVYTTKYNSPEVFASSSIPITFLISKDGKIKIKEIGAANWDGDKMKNFVNKLINE